MTSYYRNWRIKIKTKNYFLDKKVSNLFQKYIDFQMTMITILVTCARSSPGPPHAIGVQLIALSVPLVFIQTNTVCSHIPNVRTIVRSGGQGSVDGFGRRRRRVHCLRWGGAGSARNRWGIVSRVLYNTITRRRDQILIEVGVPIHVLDIDIDRCVNRYLSVVIVVVIVCQFVSTEVQMC